MDITFNNHGITATLDESVININTMIAHDPLDMINASRFRNHVRNNLFLVDDMSGSYTNASDTTTFTFGCGTITIPNELIAAQGHTSAAIQAVLDEISTQLVEEFPAGGTAVVA